jgi:hypothetical protein
MFTEIMDLGFASQRKHMETQYEKSKNPFLFMQMYITIKQ